MTDEELVMKLTELDQRTRGNAHRITNLEELQKSVNSLAMSVNTLANNMQQMISEQREQGERLKTLEERPAQNWNSMQRTIFNTLLGALAGAIAAGMIKII